MKLLLIASISRNKNNKLKRYIDDNKTFNKLFNDYTLRNKKKENMKINYLRNESDLYPFSPRLNKNGFITFSANSSKRNYKEPSFNDFRRTFYHQDKIPLNQKLNYFFNRNNNNGRNRETDSEYFDGNDNNFSENDKNNDYNNYMPYNFFGNKNINPINLKGSSYIFPWNKKNISSRINKNINKQISEYLNDFENAKRQNFMPEKNNISNNYLNYNRDSNKNKTKSSNFTFNKDLFSSINNKNNNNKKGTLFNQSHKKEIGYRNHTDRLSFVKNSKSKSVFKINNDKKFEFNNKNKKNNNKVLYNDSQNYLNNLAEKNNKENELNLKDKNTYSNKSLNPSSLGADHTKTFYTNHQGYSNYNIKSGNNINSISSRINEPNTHFLTGLKMISGVNECFYDINKVNNNKNTHRDELSMQSLSDSKMMELANKYLSEDDNSTENYRMNNIVHSKKKHKKKVE